MSKAAVVFWSATGNTKAMAEAVAEGAGAKGAEVSLLEAADFGPDQVAGFDGIAFGCPAMGAEELEESEFEPMFAAVENLLGDKPVALFGSYGWGDGQWMREWEERCKGNGINLAAECLMVNEEPDADALEACRSLGAAIV